MNRFNFDLTQYDYSSGNSQPVPKNDYMVEISKIEEKISKGGHVYLKLYLTVKQGSYAGKQLHHNLNLNHPSEMPRNIARGTLRTIAKEVEIEKEINESKNLNMLLKMTLCAEVIVVEKVDQATGKKYYNNDIAKFKHKSAFNPTDETKASDSLSSLMTSGILAHKNTGFVDNDIPDFI